MQHWHVHACQSYARLHVDPAADAVCMQSFAGVGTPYDAHHDDWLDDKISDESKRAASQSFLPSCSSKVGIGSDCGPMHAWLILPYSACMFDTSQSLILPIPERKVGTARPSWLM